MDTKLDRYHTGDGLIFHIRPSTSDVKSIDEVVNGKGYERSRPFPFSVEAGERWLDLGANIGAFSVYALSKGAGVIAVEPDPENYELMCANIKEQAKRMGEGAPMPRYGLKVAVVGDSRKKAILHQNTANGNVWRNSIERAWRGGGQVEVRCVHISTILDTYFIPGQKINIKMDIEGTEMPIIEWLVTQPEILRRINKLVFEWSFDVDPDLKRFRKVMNRLKAIFGNVAPNNMYQTFDVWEKSWFPPCKTIFCKK